MPSLGWITYYFPPLGGAGINRMVEIPPRLAQMGWDVTVYTPHPGKYAVNIPIQVKNVKIRRFFSFDPFHLGRLSVTGGRGRRDRISFPDNKILAVPFLMNVIRRHDVYVVSAPPFSLFLAGIILSKMGMKWVAEFRDPYVDGSLGRYAIPIFRHLAISYEKAVAKNANAIVSLSPSLSDVMKKRYKRKVYTITNGYNEEDFAKLKKKRRKEFVLTYMGTFNRTHSPENIIKALEILEKANIKDFRFRVIGSILEEFLKKFKRFKFFEYAGFMNRRDAVREMASSDALLLLLTPEESPFPIPGKTFEYIRAGKPIILVSEDGGIRKLLGEACVHTRGNPKDIAETILKVKNGKVSVRPLDPKPFEWQNIAKSYNRLLWSLL